MVSGGGTVEIKNDSSLSKEAIEENNILIETESFPVVIGEANIYISGWTGVVDKEILTPKIAPPTFPPNELGDSIYLESYKHPPSTYAGKQRRGIHQNIAESKSWEGHISQAILSPSKFSEITPAPRVYGEIDHAVKEFRR